MTNPALYAAQLALYRRGLVMVLAIICFGVVAYANSFQGVFVFDDNRNILNNPRVTNYQFRYFFLPPSQRPVTEATLALNYTFGQTDPTGYHVLNLLIHIAVALILFDLIQFTLSKSFLACPLERAMGFAFCVAALWVVHPLQTQSVTYIIQRGESLASLFYVSAILCVARGAFAKTEWRWYLAALVSCFLAINSKQIAVSLPIVLLLYDKMFLADSWKTILQKRGWMYAGLLLCMFWVLAAPVTALFDAPDQNRVTTDGYAADHPDTDHQAGMTAGFSYRKIRSWEYLRTQAGVLLHYLKLSLWPDPLVLDYNWPVTRSFSQYALQGSVILGLILICCLAYWKRCAWGYAGLAFFLILAPTSSIMPIEDICVEHRMYLSLVCVLILVIALYCRLCHWVIRNPKGRVYFNSIVFSAVLITSTILTWDRNYDYHSGRTLWAANVIDRPQSAVAQSNYAYELILAQKYRQAIDHAGIATKLDGAKAAAYLNLGVAQMRLGQIDEALKNLLRSEDLYHDPPGVLYENIAAVYQRLNQFEQATKYCERAIKADPQQGRPYLLSGEIQMAESKLQAAFKTYKHALQQIKTEAYQKMFNYKLGEVCYLEGTQLQQDDQAILADEKIQAAIEYYSKALSLSAGFIDARIGRARAYQQLGQCDAALRDCKILLNSIPKNSAEIKTVEKIAIACARNTSR